MNKPLISLVVAMANNRVIGKGNDMPWHLPADLKHFKAVTLGKPIIMGRRTYDSIGRPLPGRRNIVLSRNPDLTIEGCEVVSSFSQALQLLVSVDEVMVIGGGHLYSEVLTEADKLYITLIDLEVEGDTCFPEYQQLELTEISRVSHQKDEKNPYNYQFVDFIVNKAVDRNVS